MRKQVYISADYDRLNGDQDVVNELNKWGNDSLHKVDFIDMSKVSSGSVANGSDCRICDLKAEFNRQINASSAVLFVVGAGFPASVQPVRACALQGMAQVCYLVCFCCGAGDLRSPLLGRTIQCSGQIILCRSGREFCARHIPGVLQG